MRIFSNAKKQKKIVKKTSTEIINSKSPFAFVEAYKSLRTNINFATFDGEIKVILVTSALSNEGKSTVSINLSKILSMSDKKVLLIDSDLRMPSLQRYFNIRKTQQVGLSSVLSGQAKIHEAINFNLHDKIDVILAGPIPPNASELLSREYVKSIFSELREEYDYIIIDTPPVGVVTDAAILSKYVDGVLMVVRQGFASADVVLNAYRNLETSGVKMIGAIFNNYHSSKNLSQTNTYEYTYHYGGEKI